MLDTLRKVIDPEIGINIVELNMVKNIEVDDGTVNVHISLTVSGCPMSQVIRDDVEKAVRGVKGVIDVIVQMDCMSPDELERLRTKLQHQAEETRAVTKSSSKGWERLEKKGIRRIIAIASGKGGVGKSFVTALLACDLRRQRYEVGVLDADVTGSSIAKIFGLTQKPNVNKQGILPVSTKTGIKVISVNLLLDDPQRATIWRGPIISSVIKQLYSDVDWGNLHYLLVDLPPGTSDAPLTVFQSLPIDGVVVVTTPQNLTLMVVSKSVNMAKVLKIPIIGIIENMGYIQCLDCGKMIQPFGQPKGEEVARQLGVPLIGVIPLDPRITELVDQGRIEEYYSSTSSEIGRNLRVALRMIESGTIDEKRE